MSKAPLPVTAQLGSGQDEGVFSPRRRRVAVLYVVATLPLVALSGLLANGQEAYLRVLVTSGGLYATPGLVVAWSIFRRVPASDRWRWKLWFAGLIITYLIGEGLVFGTHTSSWPANPLGPPAVAVSTLLLLGVVMGLVRTRSGRLALSVDLTECAMVLVVVTAPVVVLWGDDIVTAPDSWYAVPAALATLGSMAGFYWTAVLYVRLGLGRSRRAWRAWRSRRPRHLADGPAPAERPPLEATVVRIGLALTFLGTVDGAMQVAQGVTGFELPGGPVMAVHGMCLSMVLLFPLFQPLQISPGYHRLPPQAQVRGAGLAPLLTLAGLPVLLVATMVERDGPDWVPVFSVAVVALLAFLAVLRQLVGIHETRRLYAQVEKASDERRDLLARLIQQMSNDRHAVAAQLHEQAMSAYATFVSFVTARSSAWSPDAMTGASGMLGDDLAKQAESLRQLMLAIRPMAMERSPSDNLGPPMQAYLDSLYGDAPTPALQVVVDEEVVLDWITETIVSRIVQEALRNVWRHSSATRVTVTIRAIEGQVEVRVADDGVGFDTEANLFEAGIAAMRSFAAFTNGWLDVESRPGVGTTVVARLGEPPPPRPQPGSRPPHLHLVPTDGPSPARA